MDSHKFFCWIDFIRMMAECKYLDCSDEDDDFVSEIWISENRSNIAATMAYTLTDQCVEVSDEDDDFVSEIWKQNELNIVRREACMLTREYVSDVEDVDRNDISYLTQSRPPTACSVERPITPAKQQSEMCEYFDRIFDKRADYVAHLFEQHPESHSRSDTPCLVEGFVTPSQPQTEMFSILCEYCDRRFDKRADFVAHLFEQHPEAAVTQMYTCQHCQKQMFCLRSLKIHQVKCSEPAKMCFKCGNNFNSTEVLFLHLEKCTG